MMVFCHQCHKLNRGHALFCARCGRSLDAVNASQLPLPSPDAASGTSSGVLHAPRSTLSAGGFGGLGAVPPVRVDSAASLPPAVLSRNATRGRQAPRPPGRAGRWFVVLAMAFAGFYVFKIIPRAIKPVGWTHQSWPTASFHVACEAQDGLERCFNLNPELRRRLVSLLAQDGAVKIEHLSQGIALSGGRAELDAMQAFIELLKCSPREYESKYRRSRSGLMEMPGSRTYIFSTRTRAKAFADVLERAEAAHLIRPVAERNIVQVRAGDYDHHIIGEAARLARARQVLDY